MGSLDNLSRQNRPYITDIEINALLKGTPDSRYAKVKRLLAHNKLIHIRRGLYCLAREHELHAKIHPFELAQFIYGPSYISLESALAYHQLIPEAVHTTTSCCIKRSKSFNTPLGIFSYAHLPKNNLFCQVELVSEHDSKFFIAKPWKAICDYVYVYKKDWKGMHALIHSLRIDRESLPSLLQEEIEELKEFYHQQRINLFLKHLARELSQ